MFKNYIKLEVEGKNGMYKLECPQAATLGELLDVVHTMESFLVKKIQEHHEQKKKEEVEDGSAK